MSGIIKLLCLSVVCFFQLNIAMADPIANLENRAQNILLPAQIADATVQLDAEDKHLLGIEDTRFVPVVVNCSNLIADAVDIWKQKYGISSTRQEIKASRVYVEIETREPVQGALIVIYRYLSADKRAYLKILFDSNLRINPLQQEQVAARYRLVELKRTLVKHMKCQ